MHNVLSTLPKVSAKSAKEIIYDALVKTRQILDDALAGKFDPGAAIAAKSQASVLALASDLVDSGEAVSTVETVLKGVLEQIAAFQGLSEAVKVKKAELRELTGVESEFLSLATLTESKKSIAAAFQAEITDLEVQRGELRASLEAENDQLSEELEDARLRLDRQESLRLQDKRESDDRAARQPMAEAIASLARREKEVEERDLQLVAWQKDLGERDLKLGDVPARLQKEYDTGFQIGTKAAELVAASDSRVTEAEHKAEIRVLSSQVESLERQLDEQRDINSELRDKVDAAYNQIKDISTKVVDSAGGQKVVDELKKAFAALQPSAK